MTVPTPYVVNLSLELTLQEKEKFMSIDNIGVVCVVLELAKSVSDKFGLTFVMSNLTYLELSNSLT